MSRLKNELPDLNIVVGGPQVTADPEPTLSRLPEVFCGVIGEGEETFLELLSLSSFGVEVLKGCQGLVVPIENGFLWTEPRAPIDPLDQLTMPKRKELTIEPGKLAPEMITGRGCPGRCAFCYEGRPNRSGKRLRVHSVERCLAEFDYLVQESGNKYISIADDTFVAHTSRLKEFCRGLISRYQGKIKWFCEARVDTLAKHPDMLPLMIEAGLIRIQVGGESGSQHILDVYRKGTTLEQMRAVVESAKANGLLSLFTNFIIGGAFETRDTYAQTRDFALELLSLAPGCIGIGSTLFTPYPATAMSANPAAFGIEIIDPEVVTGVGDHHAFCRTAALSRFEILALKDEFDGLVRDTTRKLSKELPPEVILHHFRGFYEWGVHSEWYERLSENQALSVYFKSVLSSGAKTFAQVAAEQFSGAYPCRTMDLVSSKGDSFLVRTPSGTIRELDALEGMLLELSASKLSFQDIVEIAAAKLPETHHPNLNKAIVDRYADFDKNYLVVWRTNNF